MPRDRDTTKHGFPPERDPFEPFPAEIPWDTPLSEISGFWLEIKCATDGTVKYPLRLMAAERGWTATLRTIVPKLNCDKCKKPPASVVLVSDPSGEAGRAGARVWSHVLAS